MGISLSNKILGGKIGKKLFGKKWNKRLFSWGYKKKKLGLHKIFKSANSASSFQANSGGGDIYGPSGSIVGKY